ncbi:ankyrin repeat-containing domain protein [Suillus clintonianus]|uniref:ankyrin repeat-containing domain protein n=1 Tax=Suillus clintonianus TaxID=1904413 RepID=UPI001B86ABD3|nr:ankyrin repeat-containing domain protein [Suillus clintonianus]KAG2138361.1 ankyrin repeat-containing domain protein [Suillus clintonianus]
MASAKEKPAIYYDEDHCDSGDETVLVRDSKDHPLLSYAIRGWQHLGHLSDEDVCVMNALSLLNSEFIRNTKKHLALAAQDDDDWRGPMWLTVDVTLPSLLFIPIKHGKPWIVEFLVKQQPHLLDVDTASGWVSPLIFAMAMHPDFLSIILKLGVDLNKLSFISCDQYPIIDGSYAPISWAAAIGSEVAVDFLLSQTEVILPNDILQMTAMSYQPPPECIRKFRERGADVNFTANGSTPIHTFLPKQPYIFIDESRSLSAVKALIELSYDISLQDRTARTVLHIALDHNLDYIVAYLLEQNAELSATATLHPDMRSWAKNETFKGKVIDATTEFQLVEFSSAITADRGNPDPISVQLPFSEDFCNNIRADYQSLQNKIQDSPKDDSLRLKIDISYFNCQHVYSRLFDYHQGDEVSSTLRQMTEDKGLGGVIK